MSGLTWYLRTSITSGMDALRRSGPVVLRAAKRASNAASVGANAMRPAASSPSRGLNDGEEGVEAGALQHLGHRRAVLLHGHGRGRVVAVGVHVRHGGGPVARLPARRGGADGGQGEGGAGARREGAAAAGGGGGGHRGFGVGLVV